MTKEEFLKTLKKEGLHFNLLFQKPHNDVFAYGYYQEDGKYIVFETDERASEFLKWNFKTESEAIDFLLKWLRDQAYIDSL
ncbi:Imm59 family immunity protein [Treponema sp. C6A8]|uniref:Imm59 family immunity protein n=1 Tax=Treponema sp. C6A8 TaxID=1410609 RepID=UPI00048A3792|nr:Imm59 family immunity protein [Treponema sp. C6A8]